MNAKWLIAWAVGLWATAASAQITGAGSSFAANLYVSWDQMVVKSNSMRLTYEPIGSSGGIKALQDRRVDFGASDRPLSRSQLDHFGFGQFPVAIGGVVVSVNLPHISSDKLVLDGKALAGIYLGAIRQWNDPALVTLNPELALPNLPIVPVYRAEGSGTSFVLTTYLSKLSSPFKDAVGATSNLIVRNGKAGKTSAEVAKIIQQTPGAIGYYDFSYASDLGLPVAQMKNQWGRVVSASPESLQVAMRSADWERLLIDQDPTFELDITDAGCPGCWPIANTTYVVVPLKGTARTARVLDFFELALSQGDATAIKAGYVPLPTRAKNIVGLAMRRWYAVVDPSGSARPQRRSQGTASADRLEMAQWQLPK